MSKPTTNHRFEFYFWLLMVGITVRNAIKADSHAWAGTYIIAAIVMLWIAFSHEQNARREKQ